MERQLAAAVEVARRLELHDGRILDVGCGTGWLGAALQPFGAVTGVDLSEASIARGRAAHPALRLVAGTSPRWTWEAATTSW